MGQEEERASISAVSKASPCEITTAADHGFASDQLVRITDLNGAIPVPRGMTQINNGKYRIIVTDTDKFTIHNPITGENVDSSNYETYVSGGSANVIATDFEYEA